MDVQWKAGQRVFALTEGSMPWRKDGTYAGYYAAKEDHLATPAATMTFEEAGATPLAALTAYQVDHPNPASARPSICILQECAVTAARRWECQYL